MSNCFGSEKFNLFSEYPRHKTINEYLEYLKLTYPNLVTIKNVGRTFEGRLLKSIRISSNRESILRKNCIFIDAGTHAREWITISTALFCIHKLVEQNQYHKNLLNHFDWVILPVVNADGYEYSHEKDRFWRKTRRPNTTCKSVGTDLNRNYDFHWDKACGNPKKITYRGERPFSEPETKAVKQIMESLNPYCKFYLTLHSYAQAFLYPWGYTRLLPDKWKRHHNLAKIGHDAIKAATGTVYRYGSISSLIHRTIAGGSIDYALGTAKIPHTLCMELPPGGSGFDPPPIEIIRLVRESWIGIQAMVLHLNEKYSLLYQPKRNSIIPNRPVRLSSAPIIHTKKYESKSITRCTTCTSKKIKNLTSKVKKKL